MAAADHPNPGGTSARPPTADFRHPSWAQEIDVLAFVAAGRRFAVELHSVEEVFTLGHITPVPLAPECIRGATNLRGQLVVLVDLGVLTDSRPQDNVLPGSSAVLVKWADYRAGLLLERVIDVLAVPLGRYEQHRENGGIVAGQFMGAGGGLDFLNIEAALEEVQRRSAMSASRLMAEESQ